MYTNLPAQKFTKETFMEYIERYLVDDIKLNSEHIGKFMVTQCFQVEKNYYPMFGITITSETGPAKLIWAAFKMDWYNKEQFKDNEYKTKLTAIGPDSFIAPDRAWYNCDLEHRLNEHDALIVDDPVEALDIAHKLNEYKIGLE